MTSKEDTGSAPDDDKVEEEAPAVTPPIEVKVTNTPVKEVKWNDDKDDTEYDIIVLSDEDKNI